MINNFEQIHATDIDNNIQDESDDIDNDIPDESTDTDNNVADESTDIDTNIPESTAPTVRINIVPNTQKDKIRIVSTKPEEESPYNRWKNDMIELLTEYGLDDIIDRIPKTCLVKEVINVLKPYVENENFTGDLIQIYRECLLDGMFGDEFGPAEYLTEEQYTEYNKYILKKSESILHNTSSWYLYNEMEYKYQNILLYNDDDFMYDIVTKFIEQNLVFGIIAKQYNMQSIWEYYDIQ